MEPSRVSRILEDWSAVAHEARRPAAPPRGMVFRTGFAGTTLASAGLVVAALVIAGVLLSRQGPIVVVGSSPSPLTPSASPVASPSASPVASPSTSPEASPSASVTAAPTVGHCEAAQLAARITLWEGAAGHRIAHVELSNVGTVTCTVEAMARPQLVDGNGAVLINGAIPPTSEVLSIRPGEVLTTLVEDANYCGPAPVPPVSVAFVFSGDGRVVASPVSPTDTTLPPCNGPGSPADIEMQPWAR
jgi:hypothetical protein